MIFARRPQLGVGKRRLAADVGDVEALRFARGALERLDSDTGARSALAVVAGGDAGPAA